jgi:hypothetical protein
MNDLETSNKFRIEPKYFIIAILVSIGNIMFYDNFIVSLFMVGLEIVILMYYLLKSDFMEYICYYLIFLAPCIEFEGFVTTDMNSYLYGFKNFRIAGFNLALIFIVIPVIYMFLMKKFSFGIFTKNRNISKIVKYISLLTFSATIMGAINIVFNDNSIRNIQGYWMRYFEQAYENYWVLMVITVTFFAIVNEASKKEKLENSLFAVLFSSVVALIFSSIIGIHGTYGSLTTLLAPTVSWFIPFLIVLPLQHKYKNIRIIMIATGIAGSLVVLLNNANGKIILFFGFSLIVALFFYVKKNILLRFLPAVLLCFIIIMSFNFVVDKFINENQLLKSKFEQVIGLVKIWDDDWLENMPSSPKFRITEFLNTGIEYTHKPWQIVLGKGYLGTTRDHLNAFGWNNEGAFTVEQYANGTFYALHETINELFLKNGLLGIVILYLILKRTVFNSHKNTWLLVGGIWFGILYGFSLTLSIFGIVSLVFGLSQLDLIDGTVKSPTSDKLTSKSLRGINN